MLYFPNVSDLNSRDFLGKIRTSSEKSIHNIIDSDYGWNHRRSTSTPPQKKQLETTLLFVDFSKVLDSIHRRKIEQETVTTVIMLYKNNESNSLLTRWQNQLLRHCHWSLSSRYIIAIYIYGVHRLRWTNVNRSKRRNVFLLKKIKSWRYSKETVTGTDYADYLVFLANTPVIAWSLLYSPEPAAEGIGLLVKVKLATVVESNLKAPFSIVTTPRCRGVRYSFPWIAPLYHRYVPYIVEC